MKDSMYAIVITTVSNDDQAETLANSILENKLGACIQTQTIKSFYSWKGENCKDPEVLLSIKTKTDLYNELESHIKSIHPYETPEIIQVPITNGYTGYFQWMEENTK